MLNRAALLGSDEVLADMYKNREEMAEELFETEKNESAEKNKNLSDLMEFNFNEILTDENAVTEDADKEEQELDLDGKPMKLSPEAKARVDKKERNAKRRKILAGAFSWIKEIAIALIIVWFVLTFIAQNNQVRGTSMQPTVYENDTVIVNKFIYRFQDPSRGDIIVFPMQENGKEVYYIKRIIGLPGDVVDIRDGQVYVNDILMEEDYITVETTAVDGQVVFPITVPENEYFVLGDNRPVSKDSRWLSIGTISRDEIVGKASLRVWPFDSIGVLD